MGDWNSRSQEKFWIAPEQVAAHRAGVDFVEWWKVMMEGPLERAGEIPLELSLAAAEMLLWIADARTETDARRLHCFRAARTHATRCAALLDTPEALRLAAAEELDRGHELLRRLLAILGGLIRPPPGPARACPLRWAWHPIEDLAPLELDLSSTRTRL